MPNTITEDHLLGGRVLIRQPKNGYRVAIDPIFLAASIPVTPGDTILDVGAGVGAASLCLAVRQADCRVTGLEIQREYVRLAADNIILNKMRSRIEILSGDLRKPPPRLAASSYAHIMVNPPYLEEAHASISENHSKAVANVEGATTFEQWARFCLLMVRPKGTVTFIHRADRLDHILAYFSGKLGEIKVFPLWPDKSKPAKRVLIRGRKNSNAPLQLLSGLILHESDGSYTSQANAILRDAAGLEF